MFSRNLDYYYYYYLLFSHNKDYTSITLYKDVARGPQKTTRLVRGGPLVTIILSNRTNRYPIGPSIRLRCQIRQCVPRASRLFRTIHVRRIKEFVRRIL